MPDLKDQENAQTELPMCWPKELCKVLADTEVVVHQPNVQHNLQKHDLHERVIRRNLLTLRIALTVP